MAVRHRHAGAEEDVEHPNPPNQLADLYGILPAKEAKVEHPSQHCATELTWHH